MIQIKEYAKQRGVTHQRVTGKIRRTGISVEVKKDKGKVYIIENDIFKEFDRSFRLDLAEQKQIDDGKDYAAD